MIISEKTEGYLDNVSAELIKLMDFSGFGCMKVCILSPDFYVYVNQAHQFQDTSMSHLYLPTAQPPYLFLILLVVVT